MAPVQAQRSRGQHKLHSLLGAGAAVAAAAVLLPLLLPVPLLLLLLLLLSLVRYDARELHITIELVTHAW